MVMESRRHLGSGLAAVSAALVTVAISACSALAAEPALAAGLALTPSPETVQVGDTIGLSFTGFKPCSPDKEESLTARWDGKPLSLYDLIAGPVGSDSFTADAVVPISPFGLNQIDAGCSTGTEYRPQEQGSVYVVALAASAQVVQAGESVTITGSGFTQCTDSAGNTTVELSTNGTPLGTASGSNGDFLQVITVPPANPAGPYPVTAQCSAQAGSDLASTSVYVVTLALSPSSGTPGTEIGVTGSGYTRCHEVRPQLLRDGTPAAPPGSPIVPADGFFTAGVTVPSSATPGDDYQVGVGCYPAADGGGPIAIEQFTVTSPATSGSPTPSSPLTGSTSPSPVQSGAGSSSPTSPGLTPPSPTLPGSASPSPAPSGVGSPTSPGSPSTATSSRSPGRTGGLGVPVALVGDTGAGLVVVALLLVRALSMLHGRRSRGWVDKHLRVTAGWAGPPSAEVERRPGATSVSVGLEPHLDHLGNQQYQHEEAAQ
jgi:hypothetical protein